MSSAMLGSSSLAAKKTGKARKLFTLWVHDMNFSPEDLVINPDYFPPDTKIGDIVEIYKPGNKEKALYLAIGTITNIRANLHLSVKDSIANACDLTNREEIVAHVVAKENVAVDFAEVTFKDQFISRSDMWRLKNHLKETCAYVGKSIQYSCMRAQIRELLASEQQVHSGYITQHTKIVFRSRSAEYMMLFQMSREMWDFAPDGQLYFEKAVNKFLPALFQKWQALGANHCLSMVMFSRTYYEYDELFDLAKCGPGLSASPPLDACRMDATQRNNLLRDHDGRYYHDFYTVVCIEERSNWDRVILALKTKFEEYPYMVNWRVPDADSSKYHSTVLGTNAIAEYSGFLEAINLAQNMLDARAFIDRDLTRTGQSVVVISASTGIFIVNPSLEQQTKQRMIDKGIACDLVCVTKPPLHVVPLFIMKQPYREPAGTPSKQPPPLSSMAPSSPYSFGSPSSSAGTRPAKQTFPSHKIAHWVYLFFHDLHIQHNHGAATRNFMTTCTMPDFLQQNNSNTGIIVPFKRAPASTISAHGTHTSANNTDGHRADHSKASPGFETDEMLHHHMEIEEASSSEKLSKMMDEYDATVLAPPPKPSVQPASTASLVTSAPTSHNSRASIQKDSSITSSSVTASPSVARSPSSTYQGSERSIMAASLKRERVGSSNTTGRSAMSSSRNSRAVNTSSSSVSQAPTGGKHALSSMSQTTANALDSPAVSLTTPSSLTGGGTASQADSARTPQRGLAALPGAAVSTPRLDSPAVLEVNPFTLELKPAPPASNRRRWEHLWVRHATQFDFLESDPSGPHWKSLSQPASLPLTTSYFPTPSELKENFQFYSHSVDPDESVFHAMTLESHLSEHLAQRLVQGAQIMLPDGASLDATTAYLSAGNSFHQLTIRKPNIIVNWYVAKNKFVVHDKIQYKYFLWTEHTSRRLTKEVLLHYKSTIHYPWNSLDQLLSGYQLEFMDSYNYWNINMMLVPTDKTMNANTAIAGFNKFKEFLTQRYVKISDPDFAPMKVNINVPLNASPSPSPELHGSRRGGSLPATSHLELIEPHNTHLILAALKETNLVNEKYFKSERPDQKTFVFIASKVVDWMIGHVAIRTRAEAIEICAAFVTSGVFKPISLPVGSPFRDGANYYAIDVLASGKSTAVSSSLLASASPAPGSAPIERKHAVTSTHALTTSSSDKALATHHDATDKSESAQSSSIPISTDSGPLNLPHASHLTESKRGASGAHHVVVQTGSNPGETSVLANDPSFPAKPEPEYIPPYPQHTQAPTGTIRLQLDPTKTDRYEWVNLVYDTVFDPGVAYEFQFQWLSSTGCVLADFVTQLTRKARSFGFSLYQIPVKHDVQHSFLSPRKDSFIWSELSGVHQRAICHVLVKVLDFLPRKKPNQFIHRTGVIIIDISNNIFEWTVNWTDVNAYSTAQNFELLTRFRDFMTQVNVLKAQSADSDLSYTEFVNGLLQKVSPFSVGFAPPGADSHVDQ